MTPEPLIAGRIPARRLLAVLATSRPLFHSEADFQHAFARALWQADPDLDVRLEVRQLGPRPEYLDLLVLGPEVRTAIEFKYFTRRWQGTVNVGDEPYDLKGHAATDLARHGFVRDIERLERFGTATHQNGLAIMLTNEPALWSRRGRTTTRDAAFRIHEDQVLAGALVWGNGDYPANDLTLAGTYTCVWQDYSRLPDGSGPMRYLLIETPARVDHTE